jgi:hypothetical protein
MCGVDVSREETPNAECIFEVRGPGSQGLAREMRFMNL